MSGDAVGDLGLDALFFALQAPVFGFEEPAEIARAAGDGAMMELEIVGDARQFEFEFAQGHVVEQAGLDTLASDAADCSVSDHRQGFFWMGLRPGRAMLVILSFTKDARVHIRIYTHP